MNFRGTEYRDDHSTSNLHLQGAHVTENYLDTLTRRQAARAPAEGSCGSEPILPQNVVTHICRPTYNMNE